MCTPYADRFQEFLDDIRETELSASQEIKASGYLPSSKSRLPCWKNFCLRTLGSREQPPLAAVTRTAIHKNHLNLGVHDM
jgi:hypothetical protein